MRSLVVKVGKLARVLSVPSWRRALIGQRVAAGVEHTTVLRNMPGLRTIVDVGANRGQFALAAQHFFPEAEIISFEPLARPAANYRLVFRDTPRVTLIDAALGPEAAEAVMHVSRRDDSSSLLPITSKQDDLFPGTAEIGTETVRVARLSECLPAKAITEPALLKVDVQGFELQALVGCEDLLDRFEWAYIECSFVELYAGQARAHEIIAWLRGHDFDLSGVYHTAYDAAGRTVQADFVFARRRR